MGRKLQYWVHVPDADGAMQRFGPGDDVPAWAVEKITNENAWEPAEPDSADGPPPRSGRGSGAEAWASYAAANEVDVEAGASREDVIAALEAAGVPTE